MAEKKSLEELRLQNKLKELIAQEQAAKQVAGKAATGDVEFSIDRDDLVKGIILREVLGPPKAFEG